MLAESVDVRVVESMRFVGQLARERIGGALRRFVFGPITIQSCNLIFT